MKFKLLNFGEWKTDQIDNQHTVEELISLIAKRMEFLKMQSEIFTDYNEFGLRNLLFQKTDDELQNVSKNIAFFIHNNFSVPG